MDAAQLDIIVRIAAATVMLSLAARLGRAGLQGRLFMGLAVCLTGFLAGNTPDPALRLSGVAGEAARIASGFAAVFIWWFCLACFDRAARLRGLPLWIGTAWFAIAAVDRLASPNLSPILVMLGFGIVAHLAWTLLRDHPGDLIENRREARILVVLLLGGELLVDLTVDAVFGFDWRPRGFAIVQNASILAFGLWLSARLLVADPGVLTFRAPATAASVDTRLHDRLVALIERDRIQLDPELTFAAFVARMGAPERAVRDLINRQLGHDHFRSFLNHHRLAEARRLLADPRRSNDKLITIALDSGFASLASFNRVFRAGEGRTPSAFRADPPAYEQRSAGI